MTANQTTMRADRDGHPPSAFWVVVRPDGVLRFFPTYERAHSYACAVAKERPVYAYAISTGDDE